MVFPTVFTGVFGTIFILGGMITKEFLEICYMMTAVLGIYPIIVALLIINTRYVITDQRVIEQTGVLSKRSRYIELKDIVKISFYQSGFGKVIKCGDVMIRAKTPDKKSFYRVFRCIRRPHEFIVNIQDVLSKRNA
jgi:uncharacterized membrane protein YdbT with pleckstrin-like domain